MSFLRTTDRVYQADSRGHVGAGRMMGEVTSDDVSKWVTVGTSVISAASPLIQTFAPQNAQAQLNSFLATLNKTVNPVATPPQPPPPSVPSAPPAQSGLVVPTWAPWALLLAVGGYFAAGALGGGGRRRNPVYASNPRRRTRRRRNPLTKREAVRVMLEARKSYHASRALAKDRPGYPERIQRWRKTAAKYYRGRGDGLVAARRMVGTRGRSWRVKK